MSDIIPATIIWWIVTVDAPLITGFFILAAKFRREVDQALLILRDALNVYKLEVAQSYASVSQMKDLESRLVAHLLRIETKLENSLHVTLRDKGGF